jgi:2-polyprenyl-3-methyl-5-hydroxy-6-metoxy-1,4-benzoquinol methylase
MASKRSWDFYYRTVRRILPDAEHAQATYFRLLRRYVCPGIRWLDAGCGHSLVPDWMKGSSELEGWFLTTASEVVGCDVDFPSLSAHTRLRCVACNLEHLCFLQEHFDLVTSNVVVEHLENPGQVFRELFRVLKPGGILIVHTPNLWHWATMISRMTPHWFHQWAVTKTDGRDSLDVFPTRYRANTRKKLKRQLLDAGFADTVVGPVVGRPQLVGFGPLLYLECYFYRALQRFPQFGQFLCAIAKKPWVEDIERSGRVATHGNREGSEAITEEVARIDK